MAMTASDGNSASAEGVKRSADAPPDGASPAKAVKVEPLESKPEQKAEATRAKEEVKKEDVKTEDVKKEEVKEEKKEEIKEEKKDGAVKKENGAENGKDKEKKEKKEKKDKSEKKDKKDKKDQKDGAAVKKEAGTAKTKPPLLKKTTSEMDLDHRKLFKEGQRFLTPPMADSTRAFYESLLQENPESKIAIKFCVEYGLMPLEEHKRLLKKYLHLKERGVYDMRTQIKRALEKKAKRGEKDKKDKKEKKEKKDGEKKEKKEKEDKDKAPTA